MENLPLSVVCCFLFLFCNCRDQPVINEATEKEKIITLHNQQRACHFEKLAETFAEQLSESHISVNKGEISRPTKAENIERFKNYFNSVEFEKWDDIHPPVIRFSDDYTLAYTVVNKMVVIRYRDEQGKLVRQATEFSWVAIYKKYQEGWKIDCVASTNKPSVVSTL